MDGLRFHWMLPKGGEVARDGRQTPLEAARYRIESMQPESPARRPDMDGCCTSPSTPRTPASSRC